MSEFRQDALRRYWVIVAEERAARPHAFQRAAPESTAGQAECPFCVGRESLTPPALATYPPVPSPWRVRATTNKFPAVRACGESTNGVDSSAAFVGRPGFGHHEVIIESADHVTRCTDLDDEQVGIVWSAYADRLIAASQQPGVRYARVFQNCGPTAGASIDHLHSQLIAMPFIPNESARDNEHLKNWRRDSKRTGIEDLIAAERNDGARILLDEDGLIAFCPYASRLPYEVWITPHLAAPRFENSPHELLSRVGRIVRSIVNQYDELLHAPDYNYLIQSAPFDRSADSYYHWRIELFPRLTIAAGFEMSSGCYINPISPETAASRLRNVQSNS